MAALPRASRLARLGDRMNKTERAYAELLDVRQRAGQVAAWYFGALTLRLGDDCRYTPEFLVLLPDGTVELHEVKGFFRDDARVKIRAAASSYPFLFRLIRRDRAGWHNEEVPA